MMNATNEAEIPMPNNTNLFLETWNVTYQWLSALMFQCVGEEIWIFRNQVTGILTKEIAEHFVRTRFCFLSKWLYYVTFNENVTFIGKYRPDSGLYIYIIYIINVYLCFEDLLPERPNACTFQIRAHYGHIVLSTAAAGAAVKLATRTGTSVWPSA